MLLGVLTKPWSICSILIRLGHKKCFFVILIFIWRIRIKSTYFWPKVKLGNTTHPDDPSDDSIDWNIGDVDCSSAKYFYSGRFIGFKYRNEIIWYEQKDSNKNIEKVAFLPSGNGIILYSDGKHRNCFYFGLNVHYVQYICTGRIIYIKNWKYFDLARKYPAISLRLVI